MNTGFPALPNSPYYDSKKMELIFTSEQLKKMAFILPRGYSLTNTAKNTKKSSKNQSKKN